MIFTFFLEKTVFDAEAVAVNTSALTAIGNDYSFDKIFSRQVEAKGNECNVLLAFSTSGNSKKVIVAIKIAKNIGIQTIGLIGDNKGSLICKLSDYFIYIPSNSTPRIQETHIICEFMEKELYQHGEK